MREPFDWVKSYPFEENKEDIYADLKASLKEIGDRYCENSASIIAAAFEKSAEIRRMRVEIRNDDHTAYLSRYNQELGL